jgi:hypothetical protein
MSYSFLHEVQTCTAVTGACHASLTAPNARNLVVSRGNILEIYNIPNDVSIQEAPTEEGADEYAATSVFSQADRHKYMNLIGSFRLYGNILSMRAIRPNPTMAIRYAIEIHILRKY